jgi:hypothetical protein
MKSGVVRRRRAGGSRTEQPDRDRSVSGEHKPASHGRKTLPPHRSHIKNRVLASLRRRTTSRLTTLP